MEIDNYVDLFVSGKTSVAPITGLAGRIIRGIEEDDFLTLSDDSSRKIVMLVDPDGLSNMLGKTGYEMLIEIGYEPDYLEYKIKEGNQFKLVIFPDGEAAKLATWDNLFEMLIQVYPKTKGLVEKYRDILKTKSFEEIESESGFKFLEVEKLGEVDPRYMTYDRLDLDNASLSEFRAFLYFSVHLRELYSGDGWTRLSSGEKGVQEYIIPNVPISQLGESRVINIYVPLP